jgi:signal transduction histidine kinase/CheY-like chemotaxis protein/HPt (histidine-containing phosphotransfer) domain-containing protein
VQAQSGTLRRRLAWLIICVVGVAVTPIAGVLAWRDGEREVSLETARLNAAARVVSSMASEAASDGDVQGAFHALRSIGQMQDVEYGRIEAPPGKLLVETGAGARLVSDVRASPSTGRSSILKQLLSQSSEVSVPVVSAGREVGTVILLGRTEGVIKRFIVSLGESLAVALAAILIGLLIAWRLQERIARPILTLTNAMRGVQENHDFDRNVTISADGEVAALIAGFNRMLSEIRERDGRIAAQMAGLESEIEARTAELLVAKDAAEAANSAKSDFLATMSHEIRTPMNGVMAMAELLAAGELPSRERRFAEVIVNSGASLLAIINDILDFSKIEAGKLELESVRIDLSEIVDDVLSLFWDRASTKGLDLAAFIDPATPQAIAGDPVRLRQVISNLVNNAIKFTEVGGVLVEIGPGADGSIRIAVQDTGIGIPDDKIDTLFAAFTQADQSTTRRFGGTGLGLAICKKLVDAMNGELRVTSNMGEGSCFVVLLFPVVLEAAVVWPRAATAGAKVAVAHGGVFTHRALASYFERSGYAPSDGEGTKIAIGSPVGLQALNGAPTHAICLGTYGDSEPQNLLRRGDAQAVLMQPVRRHELMRMLKCLETGAPLQTGSDLGRTAEDPLPSFAGSRVLVADDSAVNREVAMETLGRLGIEVKLVASGAAAVEAVGTEHFDAVLMDGSMPELDGYEATREIRRIEQARSRRKLPIIALTAHVVGAAADEWRHAGMDAVLHKPFTLKTLAETLGHFLVASSAKNSSASLIAHLASPALSGLRRRDDLFDLEVLAELEGHAASGRSDFVEKVIRLYCVNAPRCVVDLMAAVRSGSVDNVASASHALKSMSYSIGAKAVAGAASELEMASLDGIIPDFTATERLDALLTDTLTSLSSLVEGEERPGSQKNPFDLVLN